MSTVGLLVSGAVGLGAIFAFPVGAWWARRAPLVSFVRKSAGDDRRIPYPLPRRIPGASLGIVPPMNRKHVFASEILSTLHKERGQEWNPSGGSGRHFDTIGTIAQRRHSRAAEQRRFHRAVYEQTREWDFPRSTARLPYNRIAEAT